jgi:hypothetical protein
MKLLLLFFLVQSFVWSRASESEPKRDQPPLTNLTVVNVTSVEALSVMINGQEMYPNFPQGRATAPGDMAWTKFKLEATDQHSKRKRELEVNLMPNQFNVILLQGDFSLGSSPEQLPQPISSDNEIIEKKTPQKNVPNFQVVTLSNALDDLQTPLRYRFYNAMPSRILLVSDVFENQKKILPGMHASYVNQPPYAKFNVKIDGKDIPVTIQQKAPLLNCTFAFYLKNGDPAYKKIPEITAAFLQKTIETERLNND